MTSQQQQHLITATQLVLLPLLALLYSLAVHIFLSSFNERSVFKFYHWHPILTRVVLCCLCGTFWWFTSPISIISSGHTTDDEEDNASILCSILQPFITFIAAMLSIKLIIQTRQIEINGPPPSKPTSTSTLHNNKVILITGANSGIGLETARLLYHQYNATVILACRSKSRAVEAMLNIDPSWNDCRSNNNYISSNNNNNNKTKVGAINPKNRMHFLPLDLTSIPSIHTAVNILWKEMNIPKLDVLINNAGVMWNERRETVDGLEMTMAANVSL